MFTLDEALPEEYFFSLLFTPGFSQVTSFAFDGKPFKRFLLTVEFHDTWLKPDVNEIRCVACRVYFFRVTNLRTL